jgi:hypothetical protein
MKNWNISALEVINPSLFLPVDQYFVLYLQADLYTRMLCLTHSPLFRQERDFNLEIYGNAPVDS